MDKVGYIIVDEYQNINVKNIFVLGDVCGKVFFILGKRYEGFIKYLYIFLNNRVFFLIF